MATPDYVYEENELYRIDVSNGFTGVDCHYTPYEIQISLAPGERRTVGMLCELVPAEGQEGRPEPAGRGGWRARRIPAPPLPPGTARSQASARKTRSLYPCPSPQTTGTLQARSFFQAGSKAFGGLLQEERFVKEKLYPVLDEIFRSYRDGGARYGIHMGEDGLIAGGSDLDQLTWMDVRVGNIVVTPRHGRAVEINALWYFKYSHTA